MNPKLSIIVPAYNEAENVSILHGELTQTLQALKKSYEIIFVDDGSTDGTLQSLLSIQKKDSLVRVIQFQRNYGQTAAMDAGFKNAKGEIFIVLDADLQNDPADIPKLLEKIDSGYDVVSGWRFNRKDPFSKRFVSLFANRVRRRLTRETIHDSGCSLKAYRRECFNNLTLYGEGHRYIPAILSLRGYRITEVKVNHRARQHGKTKYRASRLLNGFFDLLFIKFWNDYSTRPVHLFGRLGLYQYFLAFLILVEQILKAHIVGGFYIGPLLLLSVLFVITGTFTVFFGFLMEILVRTYYKGTDTYTVQKIHGSNAPIQPPTKAGGTPIRA